MPAILALAKKSLHVRIRPAYVSKSRGGNLTQQNEVVTLSFSEFKVFTQQSLLIRTYIRTYIQYMYIDLGRFKYSYSKSAQL